MVELVLLLLVELGWVLLLVELIWILLLVKLSCGSIVGSTWLGFYSWLNLLGLYCRLNSVAILLFAKLDCGCIIG